jgi:hypothetical protein
VDIFIVISNFFAIEPGGDHESFCTKRGAAGPGCINVALGKLILRRPGPLTIRSAKGKLVDESAAPHETL